MQRAEEKESKVNIERTIKAALEYKNNIFVIGASNKIEDLRRTNGWSFSHLRYENPGDYKKVDPDLKPIPACVSVNVTLKDNAILWNFKKWFYDIPNPDSETVYCDASLINPNLDPTSDPQFNLTDAQVLILLAALLSASNRCGTCGSQSRVICKYLWEHSAGIHRIEIVSLGSYDHVFVVINRLGDLKNPRTWGDAWIIDPWYKEGLYFHANNFDENINEMINYLKYEIKECKKIGVICDEPKSEELIGKCEVEIVPALNRYPRYAKDKIVDDYYTIDSIYPGNIAKHIVEFEAEHKEKFQKCLNQLKLFDRKKIKTTQAEESKLITHCIVC